MRMRCLLGAMVIVIGLSVGGCIIGDALTTMTIDPDGSADLVVFKSNLRSNLDDEKKRREEIEKFEKDFEAGRGDPFDHIKSCGGEIIDSQWVKRSFPFSTLVRAKLPNAAALEKYATFGDSEDQLRVIAKFESEGTRRRYEIQMIPGRDDKPPAPDPKDAESLRKQMADTVNEFRIVTAGGKIVDSQGFTVASDKQSALLEGRRINEMLRADRKAVMYLEWEVEGGQR